MKNILLSVAGLTPQVITETLWALTQRSNPPFVPAEIHVLTTSAGAELLSAKYFGTSGVVSEFCAEYGIGIPRHSIHVLRRHDGPTLDDIRTPEDNIVVANAIAKLTRDLTADPDTRLHASLSGGRKTMSFYLGYAMSLFGRPQDSLSHVLVSSEFEACPDFYYIPKRSQRVSSRSGTPLDAKDARIDLAEIPFLRLRERVDDPMLTTGELDFARVVESVQLSLVAPVLELIDARCDVKIGDRSFHLPPREYAMYRLLAEAARDRWPGAGPDGVGDRHCGWLHAGDFMSEESRGTARYLEILDGLPSANKEKVAATKSVLTSGAPGEPETTFRVIRSKLGRMLNASIPDFLLEREFSVHQIGRSPSRFGLTLPVERIALG